MSRQEIFSRKVEAGIRTYFIDVKRNSRDEKYIVVSESKKMPDNQFEHHQVMIFQENFEAFFNAFHAVERFLNPDKRHHHNGNNGNRFQRYQNNNPAHPQWSQQDDAMLEQKFTQGSSIEELANFFQTPPNAVRARLRKLNLPVVS